MSRTKIIIIGGLIFLGISMVAYGLIAQWTDPVHQGVKTYLKTQIGELAPLEEKAIDAYNRFEYLHGDQKLEAALEEFILPNYGAFKDGIENIEPPVEELEDLHEILVEAVDTIYAGMSLRLESLEQGDPVLRTKAQNKIRDGNHLRSEWRGKLKVLANRHGVSFQ